MSYKHYFTFASLEKAEVAKEKIEEIIERQVEYCGPDRDYSGKTYVGFFSLRLSSERYYTPMHRIKILREVCHIAVNYFFNVNDDIKDLTKSDFE